MSHDDRHAPRPSPFDRQARNPWRRLAAVAAGLAAVASAFVMIRPGAHPTTVDARRDAPTAPAPTAPASVAESASEEEIPPMPAETEQITDHDVTPSAPFEGPSSNGLIGLGGGAGGAFSGRGGHRNFFAGGGGARLLPKLNLSEDGGLGTESYQDVGENGFLNVAAHPRSTFSIDVDSAAYANVRRMLVEGHLPPAAAVRVEELVNYFPYAYAPPTDGRPFAVHGEIAACPWEPRHRLVRIALKAREVARKERPASNIVFLLDVSGSMDAPNKLPLVKASMRMLLDELSERDTVSIVVYAGASGVALPPTTCEKKEVIAQAIDTLAAGGSTNGASGITLAYDTAALHFVPGGLNRVVLCTDGDWNVGVTSHDALWNLIVEKAKSGVFLSVLGFGMGNYKDDMLEQLADKGNGNYGYIDTTREAHRVLVEKASGTLMTVAKDVKIQVEWNPATVAGYRLVGYENRRLADRDFKDDTKDAGEIGAGHDVTALYEVVVAGDDVPATGDAAEVDPLRYQRPVTGPTAPTGSPEMLTVKLRYKEPDASASVGFEVALTDAHATYAAASADIRFAASVASFALLLRGSAQKGDATYAAVLSRAHESLADDPGGYRSEFLDLVAKAKALSGP